MDKTIDLARIRSALKDKQLVGFKPTGPVSPKQGRSKIGQGKPGLRKTS